MRFSCGASLDAKIKRRAEWHRWFAWHPVRVGDHDCRWLEWVERRSSASVDYDGVYWTHKYRPSQGGEE